MSSKLDELFARDLVEVRLKVVFTYCEFLSDCISAEFTLVVEYVYANKPNKPTVINIKNVFISLLLLVVSALLLSPFCIEPACGTAKSCKKNKLESAEEVRLKC